MYIDPLLARGRDRLETEIKVPQNLLGNYPLLARGRDRLETLKPDKNQCQSWVFPYSLGDAIDWKRL